MTYDFIHYAVHDAIATLTLARPEKLNAVNGGMLQEILHVCDRVDRDDEVRALIVTGAGRAFCSGADLSKGVTSFADPRQDALVSGDGRIDYTDARARDGGGVVTLRLFNLLKPVIGAINGPAAGLGVTFMLPMDIRIASRTATFGFVFARRGMIPEGASAFFLPRLIGISRALEWCYRAHTATAAEALAAGLVSETVEPEQLLPRARALAGEIAASSAPVSVTLTRQMMWRGLGMAHPMEAHRIDSRGILARSRSADVTEGVAAWMQKRPPAFSQRVSSDMPDFFPWWDEPDYR